MSTCTATKRNGQPCKGTALPGQSTCWGHSSTHANERRHYARLGGLNGGAGRPGYKRSMALQLSDIEDKLRNVANSVLKGTLAPIEANATTLALNGQRGALVARWKLSGGLSQGEARQFADGLIAAVLQNVTDQTTRSRIFDAWKMSLGITPVPFPTTDQQPTQLLASNGSNSNIITRTGRTYFPEEVD